MTGIDMPYRSILLWLCLLLLARSATAQEEDLTILDDWIVHADAENTLYRHLTDLLLDQLAARRHGIDQINSPKDWLVYQESTRQTLNRIVGPFPERTPLNVRITGRLEKEAYTVEKLIYESMPGWHVTAALFIPKGSIGKSPGILFCSGHTADGFRSETYQTMILNLVHKGFVVLAFDPFGQGERWAYLDPETGESQLGGPTRQHSYPGAQLFLLGESMAKYMIWDGVRGIDYLSSRPEVDPNRIGVAGRSGGGTQSSYIAAFDDRVAAVAPEAYLTSFERLLTSIGPNDVEQNFFHGIHSGINHGDLLIVRAPRPALMITTTRDFFSIQGARETFAEVKQIYQAYGAEDALQMVEDDADHASTPANRSAMYRFFMDVFDVEGSHADIAYPTLSQEELRVTETGQVQTALAGMSIADLVANQARPLAERRREARQEADSFLSEARSHAKTLSGYLEGEPEDVVFAGQYRRDGYHIQKYFSDGEGNYVVPWLVMTPEDTSGQHPVVVYLHPEGKSAIMDSTNAFLRDLARQGLMVVAPDLPGMGELGAGIHQGDAFIDGVDYNTWFGSILAGRSLVGIQASELSRLLRHLEKNSNVDKQRIFGVGYGAMGAVMMYTAAFDPTLQGIAVLETAISTNSLVTNEYYAPQLIPETVAGALPFYDLTDLVATLAPKKLLIASPLDHKGSPLAITDVDEQLQFVRATYHTSGSRANFQIATEAVSHVLAGWLQALLKE